ncbi:hypothetical protein NMY22_g5263 [Coprinellus aureogranulatus]|nr:hypothetical protein NMY22_g5263 [Coprinellus aureogranulatus]
MNVDTTGGQLRGISCAQTHDEGATSVAAGISVSVEAPSLHREMIDCAFNATNATVVASYSHTSKQSLVVQSTSEAGMSIDSVATTAYGPNNKRYDERTILSCQGSAPHTQVPPFTTSPNLFGLRKRYQNGCAPQNDPDQLISSHDLYDSRNHLAPSQECAPSSALQETSKSSSIDEPGSNLGNATVPRAPDSSTPGCPNQDFGEAKARYSDSGVNGSAKSFKRRKTNGQEREGNEPGKADWQAREPSIKGNASTPRESSSSRPDRSNRGSGRATGPSTGRGTNKKASALKHKEPDDPEKKQYAPFPNRSSFELGEWFHGQGSQKSLKDFQKLVGVLTSPTFSLDDLEDVKWTRVFQELGKNKDEIIPSRSQWVDDSGWKTTDVEIEVPIHSRMGQGQGMEKRVAGTLHHRSIVSILEEKIRNADASKFFHLDGHELIWQPDPASHGAPEFRVLTELYNSDAFLNAQRELKTNPPAEIGDCSLPRVVVGAMMWSDATHLSTFSTSKLWPLYMVFGNETYFDSLSDNFKDYITDRTGGKVPPNLFAYLNRELFHAQWVIILDDDLLKAIIEGIIIECSDGVMRRFFIRIFTYSADYPERVLIATIKGRSDCPCVRCLVQKQNLSQMGTAEDLAFREANPRVDTAARQKQVTDAREAIASGLAVGGDAVVVHLTHSGVPTINAFSARLSPTGFDIFRSLVVDLLHEYEIGVFKALFLHLIRVLEASSSGSVLVHELDKRYRAVPTFNQTIRRFATNVSQLRRRAARDYEDILQCAIPTFCGLLPAPLDGLVLKLLYLNARWHALAKLRMQTEATILLLEEVTVQLGDQFRRFVKAVDKINTVETATEARKRSKARKSKDAQPPASSVGGQSQDLTAPNTSGLETSPPPAPASSTPPPTSTAVTPTTVTPPLPSAASTLSANATSAVSSEIVALSPTNHSTATTATATTECGIPLASPPTTASQPRRLPRVRLIVREPEPSTLQSPQSAQSMSLAEPAPVPLPSDTEGSPSAQPPSTSFSTSEASSSINQPTEVALSAHGSSTLLSPSILEPKLKALKNSDLRDILMKANQKPALKTTKSVLISRILASTTAQAAYNELYGNNGSNKNQSAARALAGGEGSTGDSVANASGGSKSGKTTGTRRAKKMNIATVKFHALGHYPSTIRLFGPSDLYSTEWGESFHRSPKTWFKSTSKRQIRKELSRHERKRARLKKTKQRILSKVQSHKAQDLKEQRAAARNPDIHHYIGPSRQTPIHLVEFGQNGKFLYDVASLHFTPDLKKYLFRRYIADGNPEVGPQDWDDLHQIYDWSQVILKNDVLYAHRIMRIKYTTYDARRDEDIIHIETDQTNVMLHNPLYAYGTSVHPFVYGKVIAILHADVGFVGDIGQCEGEYIYRSTELLWVRWYRLCSNSGEFALDEVELLPMDEPESHTFINPSDVVRACHIVPKFAEGRRYPDGIGKSALANDGADYKKYFVNRFSDRDMFLRYEWGLAVGHTYTHSNAAEANKKILYRHTPGGVDSPSPTENDSPSEPSPALTRDAVSDPDSTQPIDPDGNDSNLAEHSSLMLRPDTDNAPDLYSDEESGWSGSYRGVADDDDYQSDEGRDSEHERHDEMFGDED